VGESKPTDQPGDDVVMVPEADASTSEPPAARSIAELAARIARSGADAPVGSGTRHAEIEDDVRQLQRDVASRLERSERG
jgi:hypothetical protein